jgi:ABC-type sugar transport system ATPase subunit
MARVQLQQLSKSYGKVSVLHDLNLDIQEGEFIVLLGPSGCGKSTLLRMICGLESISAGELRIGSDVVNHLPPAERGVAMVFQSYALYPHFSVYENMAFGLKNRGLSRQDIQARILQVAQKLRLDALLDRLPKELSGGQRQRVAIGRAIVRQPRLFLFDEPLSNLDAELRLQTRTEIARLHRELGATTVYVTHDQTEAMTLGDRIVLLHQGRIQQAGTPLELYDQPANRFVASFMGSPAMAFLELQVQSITPQKWEVLWPVNHPLAGHTSQTAEGLPQPAPLPLITTGPGQPALPRSPNHIVMGIRPEHWAISTEATGQPGPPALAAQVEWVERLGDSTLLHLKATLGPSPAHAPLAFVARVAAHAPFKPMDAVFASPQWQAPLHFFSLQGERLALRVGL